MNVTDLTVIIAAIPLLFRDFLSQPMVFLYLGPETILPLGSVIAGAIGLLLIGWRWIIAFFRKVYYRLSGKAAPAGDAHSESPSDQTADQAQMR